MITEDDINTVINNFSDKERPYAEFVAQILKGKLVEIYLGDSYEEVRTEQISTQYPAVFCGKIIGAHGECLVLSCTFVKNKRIENGNIVFINSRSIMALNELDGNGTIEDLFFRSKETISLLKNLGK